MRSSTLFLSLAIVVLCPQITSATTIIGGLAFDDNAFADIVLDATPQGTGQFKKETSPVNINQDLTLPADFAILESAVTGSDITQWISLRTPEAKLTLGFTDLIPVDGIGDDIAIVEIQSPAPISITINGITLQYVSQPSGTTDVNFVFVDLADFGVLQVPSLTISSTSIINDIAAVAAINSVPEPSSCILAVAGLASMIAWRWRIRCLVRSRRFRE